MYSILQQLTQRCGVVENAKRIDDCGKLILSKPPSHRLGEARTDAEEAVAKSDGVRKSGRVDGSSKHGSDVHKS